MQSIPADEGSLIFSVTTCTLRLIHSQYTHYFEYCKFYFYLYDVVSDSNTRLTTPFLLEN